MKKINKSMIRIPTRVIMNEEIESQESFAIYAVLKASLSNESLSVKMKGSDLAEKVGVKDSRTMHIRLKELADAKLVTMNRNYRANAHIIFTVNPLSSETFSHIDVTTFHRIRFYFSESIAGDITKNRVGYGLRIYYYLVKNYNPEYDCAFPSYDNIYEDTGISTTLISSSISLLEEIGVLKINRDRKSVV